MNKHEILESKTSNKWKMEKLIEMGYPYDYAAILTGSCILLAARIHNEIKARQQQMEESRLELELSNG